MPQDGLNAGRARERFRTRVTDPETSGVYVIVTVAPPTEEELRKIIDEVVQDEGRVERGRVRLILL